MKDEIVQLEISLSDTQATEMKTKENYETVVNEMKQVLLCLQQYHVESEVMKKGVLQLGGEEVLKKLEESSKVACDKLTVTSP